MRTSESITEIGKALVEVHKSMPAITRNAVNPFYKSSYATLDHIINTVRPSLAANGIAVIQSSTVESQYHVVYTRLIHTSGEYIETSMEVPIPEKNTPQGAGAADTYARRYGLASALCIASEEDNDGNELEKEKSPSKKLNFDDVTDTLNGLTKDEKKEYWTELMGDFPNMTAKQKAALQNLFKRSEEVVSENN